MTGLIRDDEGQRCPNPRVTLSTRWIWLTVFRARTAGKTYRQYDAAAAGGQIRKRTEKQFPNGIEPHGTDACASPWRRWLLPVVTSTGI